LKEVREWIEQVFGHRIKKVGLWLFALPFFAINY